MVGWVGVEQVVTEKHGVVMVEGVLVYQQDDEAQ